MKQSEKTQKRLKLALSFCNSAATLRRGIEGKRNPACANQNLTARRARQVASSYDDADRMQLLLQVMEGMAGDLTTNQLPKILRGVTTGGMVERLMQPYHGKAGLHKSHVRDLIASCKFSKQPAIGAARKAIKRLMVGDKHDCYLDLKSIKQIDDMLILCRNANGVYIGSAAYDLNTKKRFILAGIKTDEQWKLAHETIRVYAKGPSPEQKRAKDLLQLEHSLIGLKIPGFFPTPKRIADTMVRMADIRQGMAVLEPSAGKGDIAEVISAQHPKANLTVIEINHKLAQVLKAKRFNIRADWGDDFLLQTGFYDRIVMNPPFENGLDIDHVRWAYSRLKPEGILVSIMCSGPFFRNDKKSTAFREWFDNLDGTQDLLEAGSFQGKDSFNQTGVSSRIIVLAK